MGQVQTVSCNQNREYTQEREPGTEGNGSRFVHTCTSYILKATSYSYSIERKMTFFYNEVTKEVQQIAG